MNSRFFLALAVGSVGLVAAPGARAQTTMMGAPPLPVGPATAPLTAPGAAPIAAPGPGLVAVNADNVAALPSLLGRAGAISLGVYADDLDKNPGARDALLQWVRGGGTVFLHTDAAQLFGYRTVAAREGTASVAGQLYGRARAAVPFGAIPLLWDDGQSNARGTLNAATRVPGINTVFYTLRAGDDLVIDHPAGTPLLQVVDAASPSARPLYAAAIAPFGAGWAVFTPDSIDQRRADGAAFARNLLKLVAPSRYIGVPQTAIVSGDVLPALQNALARGGPNSAPLPAFGTGAAGAGAAGTGAAGANDSTLPVARAATNDAVGTAPIATDNPNNGAMNNGAMNNGAMNGGAMNGGAMNGGAMNGDPNVGVAGATQNQAAAGDVAGVAAGPVLLLTREEAMGVGEAVQNDPDGRGAAALAILRARVALLNGDAQTANSQLALAERASPAAGEIPFLRGALAIGDLNNGFTLSSMDRAQAANLAANSFATASRAQSLFYTGTTGAVGATGITGATGTFYGDVSGNQIDALGAQINRLSQVLALEPPLSRVVGNGASAVTIRYFEGDTSLPFVERAAAALANSNAFGWNVDGQEILLFPTPAIYQNYRAAVGLTQQNVPLPAAAVGDVVDNRILMVSIPPARPISRLPNGQVRVLPLRATSAALLARFESYALLQAYVGEGGGRVPAWMSLGFEVLADLTVSGDTQSADFDTQLQRVAATGGLLGPDQFSAQIGDSTDLAQAEALALMRYFYAQFGAGRVAETVQRLGAGESVDDALRATTGFNQIEFFRAWRESQFGITALRN